MTVHPPQLNSVHNIYQEGYIIIERGCNMYKRTVHMPWQSTIAMGHAVSWQRSEWICRYSSIEHYNATINHKALQNISYTPHIHTYCSVLYQSLHAQSYTLSTVVGKVDIVTTVKATDQTYQTTSKQRLSLVWWHLQYAYISNLNVLSNYSSQRETHGNDHSTPCKMCAE